MTSEHCCLKRLNPLGDSELILVGRKGQIDRLQNIFNDFLKNGMSLEEARNIFAHHANRLGKTVLHEAAQNSHPQCMGFLVDRNSAQSLAMDPDCLKQGDWTPLMLACTKDNLDAIRILVDAGASLNLKNKDGWTPFHIACREGHENIVDYFLSLQSVDVWKTKSKNGRTPVHTAALYGRQSVIDLLISRKAYSSIDDSDTCGSTALMDALRGGHIDIAKWLIQAGAGQADSVTFIVQTYINMKIQSRYADFDESMISAEIANCSTTDEFQSTPAHFAAKEGHVTILKLLKQYGGNLSLQDSKGRSALHMASGSQRAECVRYLLSEHVQNIGDMQGIRASDLARKPDVKKLFDLAV